MELEEDVFTSGAAEMGNVVRQLDFMYLCSPGPSSPPVLAQDSFDEEKIEVTPITASTSPATNQSYVTCHSNDSDVSLNLDGLGLDDTVERMERLMQLAVEMEEKAQRDTAKVAEEVPEPTEEPSPVKVPDPVAKLPPLPPVQFKLPHLPTTTPKAALATTPKPGSGSGPAQTPGSGSSRIPTPRPQGFMSHRSRLMNVTSPVARYIHDKPVPPLVTQVKPKATTPGSTPRNRMPGGVRRQPFGKENQQPATPDPSMEQKKDVTPVLPEKWYEPAPKCVEVVRNNGGAVLSPVVTRVMQEHRLDEPASKYGKAGQLLSKKSPAAVVLHHGRQLMNRNMYGGQYSGIDDLEMSVVETKRLHGCSPRRR